MHHLDKRSEHATEQLEAPTSNPVAKAQGQKPRRMARMPAQGETPLTAPASDSKPALPNKISLVLDLLHRPGGASLDDMVAATGWQPHSARAVLSGLRKKGHAIAKAKQGRMNHYSSSGNAQ